VSTVFLLVGVIPSVLRGPPQSRGPAEIIDPLDD
jgi:hypothetical protein